MPCAVELRRANSDLLDPSPHLPPRTLDVAWVRWGPRIIYENKLIFGSRKLLRYRDARRPVYIGRVDHFSRNNL
jgi:hypothetical protein